MTICRNIIFAASTLFAAFVTPVLGQTDPAGANACFDRRTDRPADLDKRIDACLRVVGNSLLGVETRAEAYLRRALAYAQKSEQTNVVDDINRAIADLSEGIRLQPNNAAGQSYALQMRAGLYFYKDDYDRALADYTELLRLSPDSADAYNYRGIVFAAKGEHESAVADFTESIRRNPNAAGLYNQRALSYVQLGRRADALADVNRAVTLEPQQPAFYGTRIIINRAAGKASEVIGDLRAALSLDPSNEGIKNELRLAEAQPTPTRAAAPDNPAPAAGDRAADAKGDYALAAQVGTKDAWEAFLRQYPAGFYTDLARAQITKLGGSVQSNSSKAERELQEKERSAKVERERQEKERIAREQAEKERQEKERAAKAERERAEKERLAKEQAERVQRAKEQADKERLAAEKAERARPEKERLTREKAEREEAARAEAERKRLADEKATQEKALAAKAEEERRRLAAQQAEMERREQERIAREQAEQKRLEQARIAAEAERERERQRLAHEQEERERLEKERAARVQAEAARLKTAELTPAGTPVEPETLHVLAGGALVEEIKKELKRVGCYSGPLDDKWTTAQTAASVRRFARVVHTSATYEDPTADLLDSLRGISRRICPLECGKLETEKDGQCVASTCRNGYELDEDGDCVRQKSGKRRIESSRDNAEPSKEAPREPAAKRDLPPKAETQRTAVAPPRPQEDRESGGGRCSARSCSAAFNGCMRRSLSAGRHGRNCSFEYGHCMQTGNFNGRMCQLSGLARN